MTPDELAFFAAIRANKTDDTVRLVYADWLEDHAGPGDVDRAEFIRLQCELAKLTRLDINPNARSQREIETINKQAAENRRYDYLQLRCELLLRANVRQWVPDPMLLRGDRGYLVEGNNVVLSPHVGINPSSTSRLPIALVFPAVTFSRGFIETIDGYEEQYIIPNINAICALCPALLTVTMVRFGNEPMYSIRQDAGMRTWLCVTYNAESPVRAAMNNVMVDLGVLNLAMDDNRIPPQELLRMVFGVEFNFILQHAPIFPPGQRPPADTGTLRPSIGYNPDPRPLLRDVTTGRR